jgi:hypothetical protein
VIVLRIVDVRKSVRVFHIGQPTGTRSVPRASGLVLVGYARMCAAIGLTIHMIGGYSSAPRLAVNPATWLARSAIVPRLRMLLLVPVD